MDTSPKLDFNIAGFKQNIEEAPTEKNDWNLVTEGPLRKDFPGNFL